jgi:hypothetical protein
MIAPKSMGHVAILQGSIGCAYGPVLMIPPRVKGLCFVVVIFTRKRSYEINETKLYYDESYKLQTRSKR